MCGAVWGGGVFSLGGYGLGRRRRGGGVYVLSRTTSGSQCSCGEGGGGPAGKASWLVCWSGRDDGVGGGLRGCGEVCVGVWDDEEGLGGGGGGLEE